jgi:plastocyanin
MGWTALTAASLEGTITFEKSPPAGMLVWIPGVTNAQPSKPQIDQKDKVFLPAVVAARPGTSVVMHNSDDIQHNGFASDKSANVVIDTGLNAPASDTMIEVTWPLGKVVKFGCKIHPGMQAWIAALDTDAWVMPASLSESPKVAKFTLKDLPADVALLHLWTSKYGELELKLAPGKSVTATLGAGDKPAGSMTVTLNP